MQLAIVKWRAGIFPAELGYPVAAQALTIPLAYIGNLKETLLHQLQQRVSSIKAPSFKLTLKDAGFWRQSGPIWLGCKPATRPLLQIAAQLQSIVARSGGRQLLRPYSPTRVILRNVPADFTFPAETFNGCLAIQHFSLIRLHSRNSGNPPTLITNYPLDQSC